MYTVAIFPDESKPIIVTGANLIGAVKNLFEQISTCEDEDFCDLAKEISLAVEKMQDSKVVLQYATDMDANYSFHLLIYRVD